MYFLHFFFCLKLFPSTHINLHCLILICLETLLSTSSLHVLLYWYLSELRPIMQTIFNLVAYTQLPLKFIGCITSIEIILLFQDVWFLWFSRFSRTKCVSVVITQAIVGSNPQSVESQFHRKFECKSSFITFLWDFLFMHIVKHRIKRTMRWTKNIRHFAGLTLLYKPKFKLIQLLLFYLEFKICFCHWSGNFPKIL